ncbi:carbonic anhydrase 15-like isoform X2 [Sorex araneus]|uniref:carbonic anhydrase 15-like isoform X2 n=1 Tax=Sorex araneus TaxID=42254 RepID=UPI0024338AE8|nr:carbonic anhydrase 15-like isoform X2 [Sorex araneus]
MPAAGTQHRPPPTQSALISHHQNGPSWVPPPQPSPGGQPGSPSDIALPPANKSTLAGRLTPLASATCLLAAAGQGCSMWGAGLALALLTVPLAVCMDSNGVWCYDAQDPKCGPTHWKEVAPACGGPAQSPINIDLHLVQRDPTLGPLIFQGYDSAPPGPWTLENNGHTVLLHVDSGPQSLLRMWGAGLPGPAYRALQLHFHWGRPGRSGSEHSLGGQRRSMEEQVSDNANFSTLVSQLKNVSEPGTSVNLVSTFPLASLLPSTSRHLHYFRYSGSLTTPGCQPTVLWTVLEDAVPIGHLQVAQFQSVRLTGRRGSHPLRFTENFRPQQPLGGRRVSASPGVYIPATAPSPAPAQALVCRALLGLGLSLGLWQGPLGPD